MNKRIQRQHVGSGALPIDRNLSVFINCPFDGAFSPIFDSMVFSSICCGFFPRCSFESGKTSVPRMDRIVNAIRTSKYSIHDLSRCRGEGDANLARFNMPLELGIAMAQRFDSNHSDIEHDWLVLVPRGHIYKIFLSDLSGYDPKEHDETLETVVPAVMSWLATRPDAVQTPTPADVLAILPIFQEARENLARKWSGCEPWADLLTTAIQIGKNAGLVP